MKIVIIGAGISGLTFAATIKKLAHTSIELAIYERDTSALERSQGYAIGLDDEHALPVLRSLNLYDMLVAHADSKQITNFVFQNEKGKELLSSEKISKKNIAYRVQRQLIKSTLMSILDEVPVYYGYQAVGFTQQAKNIQVQFANGEQVSADYVIACDGASSKIRHALLGDQKNYLGLTSISAVSKTKANPAFLDGGYCMVLGDDGASVFIYRQPDGIYYSYTFPATNSSLLNNASQETSLQFVTQRTSHWCDLVRNIIQMTEVSTVTMRPYYDRHPIAKIHYDRLWLIGDAAHTMSPFRGLGGNLAMVDAYQLAVLLANLSPNSQQNKCAMKQLEKKLVRQGTRAILKSRRNAKSLHTVNKAALVLRQSKFWFYRCLLKLI